MVNYLWPTFTILGAGITFGHPVVTYTYEPEYVNNYEWYTRWRSADRRLLRPCRHAQGLLAVQVGNDIGSRRNFRRRWRAVDAVQQRLRFSLALYGRRGCNRVGSKGRSIQEGSKN